MSIDTLSTFSRTLLQILHVARRPLSTEDVILKAEMQIPDTPVRGRVRPYLQHALSEYVTYLSAQDAWVLKDKYHGYFDGIEEEAESRDEASLRGSATSSEADEDDSAASLDHSASTQEPIKEVSGEEGRTRHSEKAEPARP